MTRACVRRRRSSARNIASVPCRCGQSWTVPGQRAGAVGHVGAQPGGSRQQRRRVAERHVVARRPAPRSTTSRGLGEHRRAGRVERPRRPGAPGRAPQPSSARCSGTSAVEVVRLPPPAGLGPAAQGAEPGARARRPAPGRRSPAGHGGRGAVGATITPRRRCGAGRARAATRSARCGWRSLATSRAPRPAASAASRAALPPGPAHRSSQRVVGAVERRRRPARAPPAGSPRPARRRGPRPPPAPRRGRRRAEVDAVRRAAASARPGSSSRSSGPGGRPG